MKQMMINMPGTEKQQSIQNIDRNKCIIEFWIDGPLKKRALQIISQSKEQKSYTFTCRFQWCYLLTCLITLILLMVSILHHSVIQMKKRLMYSFSDRKIKLDFSAINETSHLFAAFVFISSIKPGSSCTSSLGIPPQSIGNIARVTMKVKMSWESSRMKFVLFPTSFWRSKYSALNVFTAALHFLLLTSPQYLQFLWCYGPFRFLKLSLCPT